MDEQVSALFRELADLPQAARESIFAARNLPPELRSEVKSLLASLKAPAPVSSETVKLPFVVT